MENQMIKKRGGKRPGAGRPVGAVNKVCSDLMEAASIYTKEALDVLVSIARCGQSEAARVSAANSILDRGHGKPVQTVNANISHNLDEMTDYELLRIASGRSEGDASAPSGSGKLN